MIFSSAVTDCVFLKWPSMLLVC